MFLEKLSSRLNPPAVTLEYIDSLKVIFAAQAQKGFERPRLRDLFKGLVALAQPTTGVRIHYLSDNGGMDADLAKAEIKKELAEATQLIATLSGTRPTPFEYDDIPSQDSIAGAFDLAQLSRNTIRGVGNIIFLNCAPRKKERGVSGNNGGEAIYMGMLPNGTIVSATSSESFTFLKDLIANKDLEIFQANVQRDGTQFRSRDTFPWFTALLANRMRIYANQWKPNMPVEARRDLLAKAVDFIDLKSPLSLHALEELPLQIARRDTHGNLKLSSRYEDIRAANPNDQFFWAVINNRVIKLALNKDSFSGGEQQFVLSEGSDGRWKDRIGDQPQSGFAEIFLVGGRAIDEFGLTDQHIKKGVPVKLISHSLLQLYKVVNDMNIRDNSTDQFIIQQMLETYVRGFDNGPLAHHVRGITERYKDNIGPQARAQ